MKIKFKESNTITSIKYKSFLFVKLPLLAILYAVVINFILSFKLIAISDLLTSKGIIPLILMILLAYLAFKNYTNFKDLRENYKAKNIDGVNILVKLIRIHDKLRLESLDLTRQSITTHFHGKISFSLPLTTI